MSKVIGDFKRTCGNCRIFLDCQNVSQVSRMRGDKPNQCSHHQYKNEEIVAKQIFQPKQRTFEEMLEEGLDNIPEE